LGGLGVAALGRLAIGRGFYLIFITHPTFVWSRSRERLRPFAEVVPGWCAQWGPGRCAIRRVFFLCLKSGVRSQECVGVKPNGFRRSRVGCLHGGVRRVSARCACHVSFPLTPRSIFSGRGTDRCGVVERGGSRRGHYGELRRKGWRYILVVRI
jgi:hypothetical protein